ncbi:hypothetical protein ACQKJ1_04455 [Methylorubrum rhodesianum]|uniref:hypothetical protein n=1 Tax=Methylorubrum rhodesianum TaxID=29427 RepID=UPI003D0572FC
MARLLGDDAGNAVADMGPAKPGRITPTQAGGEQDVERETLAGADGPVCLETRDLFLGPSVEAVSVVRAAH